MASSGREMIHSRLIEVAEQARVGVKLCTGGEACGDGRGESAATLSKAQKVENLTDFLCPVLTLFQLT